MLDPQVLGRVSSLDAGEAGTPCVGVECSHERCSNMTSMYKVHIFASSSSIISDPT